MIMKKMKNKCLFASLACAAGLRLFGATGGAKVLRLSANRGAMIFLR